MAKGIITLGYTDYVLDLKEVVTIAEIMGRAERYESKYASGSGSAHHIYENDSKELATIKLISDDFYRLAKLAGKPADKA